MVNLEIWENYILTEKKERKYVECFKSNREGSCNYCQIRIWHPGYKIYAMKKPDGKWLACTDKGCYLEQGGKLTLFSDTVQPDQPKTFQDRYPDACPHGWSEWWLCGYCSQRCKHCGKVQHG